MKSVDRWSTHSLFLYLEVQTWVVLHCRATYLAEEPLAKEKHMQAIRFDGYILSWRLRRRRWQRLYPYRSNKFIIERCCWLSRGNERYVVIFQCIKCAEISDTFFVVRSSARIQDGPGYGTVEGFYKEQNDVEAISQPILGLIAHSPCFCIRIYTCELVISNRKYDLIPNFLSNIYQFYNKNN